MEFLLKHKDKIVSFGLLPTIITLIGLHFSLQQKCWESDWLSVLQLFYTIFFT